MEMTVKDERKLVEIWLTNAEKSDPVLRAGLQGIYDTYKKKKYLVAVFESGNCDLYAQTRDLLLYNRQRLAEQEIRREKGARGRQDRRTREWLRWPFPARGNARGQQSRWAGRERGPGCARSRR